MKTILIFYGYKGVGKDTCYELVKQIYSNKTVTKLSFAHKLRNTIWELFKNKIVERERVDGSIDKKEEPINGWKIPDNIKADCGFTEEFWTGRRLLQWFGTEVCRNIYDSIWVDALIDDLKECKEEVICITDCRFKNEYNAIDDLRKQGYNVSFIHVRRYMGNNEFSGHASEKDLVYFKADAVLNNNLSIEQLKNDITNILCKV